MTVRAQTVTILFTDLVSSTELLQRAGDERAQRIFKAHHRLLSEAVQAHGGHEVKWLGDGLMVAFDSARDAAQCAIAMQQASRRPAAGERLQIRVGLHVGEAFREESDYFGTPVVIARRLCDKADAGQIFASDLVVRLLEGRTEIAFDDLGKLALKGIDAPVHAHEVRYEHDPLAMLAVTPFVGRDDVLAALSKKQDEARAGSGSLVMLVGEPGIGKTRTASEFADAARQVGALVLWGRCYDGEWAAPFSPFMEAIRAYAADAPVDGLRETLGADAGVLARIVPALHERLPDIAEPPAIPAEGERYRLLEAAGDFFARLAASRPLVLLLDDLHWADKGTIAMLRQLARLAPEQRLLIIGAYRDIELDRTHPLADALQTLRRETNYERYVLKGLEAADVSELLTLVAEQAVPEAFAKAIGDETGGNPFFIREVMLHLVEEKQIVQEDGRWIAATAIADMRIPEGVREVIGRRLSRVSEPCGRMLTVASALTAGFSWDVISALVDLGDAPLLDAIDEALGAQLIVERERGSYDFTHALIRHTLYEELSTPKRVLLHRQIGEALERLYADDVDEHLAELAHHFYQTSSSGDGEKALEYCTRAGDAAMSSIAHEAAVGQYERAVGILDSSRANHSSLAELLITLGRAQYSTGLPSTDTFVRAAEVATECGRPDLVIRAALRDPLRQDAGWSSAATWPLYDSRLLGCLDTALPSLSPAYRALKACGLAQHAQWASDPTRSSWMPAACGIELTEQAERIARDVGDERALGYVLYWQGFSLNGDARLAERQLGQASELVAISQRLNDPPMVRAAHMWRAFALLRLGDPAWEIDLEAFHRVAEELRQPQTTWWSSACIAMRTLMRGDLQQAEIEMVKAAQSGQGLSQIYGPEGNPDDVGVTLQIQLYGLRFQQGRLGELEAAVQAGIEQFPDVPAWRAALALLHFDSGRAEEARQGYERIVSDADSLAAGPNANIAVPLTAELCNLMSDAARAQVMYDLLVPYRGRMLHVGWRAALGAADRLLGAMAALRGDLEEARILFESALDMNTRMGARPWTARTQLDYARMLLKRDAAGDIERARELLDAALATATEIGMAKVKADCEALLA